MTSTPSTRPHRHARGPDAEQRDDRTEETRRVVEAYVAALGRGDLATLRASFAPDATRTLGGDLPVSGTWNGPEGIIDGFLARMTTRLDTSRPLTQEIHGIVADADRAVVEWTSRATTTEGAPYQNDYAVAFDVRNGLIVAVREYFDSAYAARVLFGSRVQGRPLGR